LFSRRGKGRDLGSSVHQRTRIRRGIRDRGEDKEELNLGVYTSAPSTARIMGT